MLKLSGRKLRRNTMDYLLTGGVIAFQFAILFSVTGAARFGRKALLIATVGWILFTLFGSIVTAGLMLLQLLTISVAYKLGSLITRKKLTSINTSVPASVPPVVASTPTTPRSQQNIWYWFVATVCLSVVTTYMYNAATEKPVPSPTAFAPTPLQVQPIAHESTSITAERNVISPANNQRDMKADLRHCLDRSSATAVTRCINDSK